MAEKLRAAKVTVSALHGEMVQKEREAIVVEFLGGPS